MAPTTSWPGRRRPGRHGFPPATAQRIIQEAQGCALAYPSICTGTPTHADHIIGWADATAHGWDPEDIDDHTNGQAVCTACHTIKTRTEQQRGRARTQAARPTTKRPTEPHPGLTK